MLYPYFALWNLTWSSREPSNFLPGIFTFWETSRTKIKRWEQQADTPSQIQVWVLRVLYGRGNTVCGVWEETGRVIMAQCINYFKSLSGHFKLRIHYSLILMAWGMFGANKLSTYLQDSIWMYVTRLGFNGLCPWWGRVARFWWLHYELPFLTILLLFSFKVICRGTHCISENTYLPS